MAPERAGHARIKAEAWLALKRAVASAGVACEAFPDGMTVEVRDDTDYEPDALVNCGDRIGRDVMTAPNPVVVVEVLSPSTRSIDTGSKLADYFSVPSIRHYLIVHVNRPMVVHHRRRDDGGIETRLLSGGAIELDPPGITITVEELYQA